jgi:hypothetical protein
VQRWERDEARITKYRPTVVAVGRAETGPAGASAKWSDGFGGAQVRQHEFELCDFQDLQVVLLHGAAP